MTSSKYFCAKKLHQFCSHDWTIETKTILQLIDSVSTDNPFQDMFRRPDVVASDANLTDEKDLIILNLMQQLKMTEYTSEGFWQRKLQNIFKNTSLRREIISTQKYVTDFSNKDVLIELKNQKDVRTAIGQINEYRAYKNDRGDAVWFSYILLFGSLHRWTAQLWFDRVQLCADQGIILRYLI